MTEEKRQQMRSWWGQMHRGLVVDRDGKHYRKIRLALWLYAYLIVHANRQEGILRRKYETIALDMGISVSTVRRWTAILKRHGYITVTHTGRAQVIHIQRWRAARKKGEGSPN